MDAVHHSYSMADIKSARHPRRASHSGREQVSNGGDNINIYLWILLNEALHAMALTVENEAIVPVISISGAKTGIHIFETE